MKFVLSLSLGTSLAVGFSLHVPFAMYPIRFSLPFILYRYYSEIIGLGKGVLFCADP